MRDLNDRSKWYSIGTSQGHGGESASEVEQQGMKRKGAFAGLNIKYKFSPEVFTQRRDTWCYRRNSAVCQEPSRLQHYFPD